MKKIIIYEPALCCPTGVCGPSVDPELLRITALVKNINQSQERLIRINLKDHPEAFIASSLVEALIQEEGMSCLPLALCGDQVLSKGRYPQNEEVEACLGIALDTPPVFNVL